MSQPSTWFDDPALIEAEVRRRAAGRTPPPPIPGYDDLREVARGGQGVVYRATQRSTKRLVAIKVLVERSPDRAEERRRFEREIDLAASLRHPNIVSVYDSGVTEDGRPYLVMEFVEGRPLDEHAGAGRGQSAPLPVEELVGLVAQVCDAVNFAHQRGVIHRDLKPSNIRVSPDGCPRVLDFGLAKLDRVGGPERTILSQSGGFMGTLAWASPEQVSGDPAAIDIRSDVYALGVLLYQLLTARMPYETSGPLSAVVQNVLNADPTRPGQFRAGVNDELDTIILKCLAKSPERRYQTAGDLARDLRHYLAGEPIQAKRDSAWYTLSKTIRRYRMATAGAAAVFLAVSAALVIVVFALQRADRERDNANAQLRIAGATADFMRDMLNAADPDRDGRDVKVADLLDRAAAGVEEKFADHADLRASVRELLRDLYARLGDTEAAAEQGRLAVEVRRLIDGDESASTLSAEAAYWGTLHTLGRTKEVEPELRRVLASQERLFGPDDPARLATLADLAQCLAALGRSPEARPMYEEALAIWARTKNENDATVLELRERLAVVLHDMGEIDEAEALLRDTLLRREAAQGAENTGTVILRGNLAVLLIDKGVPDEAIGLLKTNLDIVTRKLGPEHPDTLSTMNNLAKVLQDAGHPDEAEEMMERTLEARIRIIGREHPHTMVTMNNLASLYAARQRPAEALPIHTDLLEIRTRVMGPQHLDTAITRNNLAATLHDLGRHEEAADEYRQAVEIAGATLGPDHWFNGVFRANYAKALIALKRYEQAEENLVPAYELLRDKLGADNPRAAKAAASLVTLYEAWGRPDEAAKYRDAASPPK